MNTKPHNPQPQLYPSEQAYREEIARIRTRLHVPDDVPFTYRTEPHKTGHCLIIATPVDPTLPIPHVALVNLRFCADTRRILWTSGGLPADVLGITTLEKAKHRRCARQGHVEAFLLIREANKESALFSSIGEEDRSLINTKIRNNTTPGGPDYICSVSRKNLGPCGIWSGGVNNGYAIVRSNKFKFKLHTALYNLNFGPVFKGLQVCHKCNNPQCTNVLHLELGTAGDNNRYRELTSRSMAGDNNYFVNHPEKRLRGAANPKNLYPEWLTARVKKTIEVHPMIPGMREWIVRLIAATTEFKPTSGWVDAIIAGTVGAHINTSGAEPYSMPDILAHIKIKKKAAKRPDARAIEELREATKCLPKNSPVRVRFFKEFATKHSVCSSVVYKWVQQYPSTMT